MPAAEGVRMRSVAVGGLHALALTDEGRVYTWGSAAPTSRAPEIPTLFDEIGEFKMTRVAAGAAHSAAVTALGTLYTWLHDKSLLELGQGYGAGLRYALSDLSNLEDALCRPRCEVRGGRSRRQAHRLGGGRVPVHDCGD